MGLAPLGLARPPYPPDLARPLDLLGLARPLDPLGLAPLLGLSDGGGCWAAHCCLAALAAHLAVGLRGCGRTRRQPFLSLRCLTQR